MRGRLEREIRLLPQVLSCSVTSDDVVVLISPSAEAAVVESDVRAIVEGLGAVMGIRVLGGYEPPTPSSFRLPMPSNAAIRGTLVGAGAAGALALAAGLTGVEVPRIPGPPPPAIVAVSDPDIHDGMLRHWLATSSFGGMLGAIGGPAGPVTTAGGGAVFTVSAPVTQPPSTSIGGDMAPGPTSAATTRDDACRTAPDRDAPHARHEKSQGKGHERGAGTPAPSTPPPWSRSILVPPHDACAHGKP